MKKKTTVLIDGDILIYEAASSSESPIHWGGGLWTLHSYESEALARLEMKIQHIVEVTYADAIVFALSDTTNWRQEVYPPYKRNRKDKRKPLLLPFLRDHVLTKMDALTLPTLEGDDVLGILATDQTIVPGNKVIASIDKDLKTIPGFHYRFRDESFFDTSEDEADRFHLMQTLAGDPTDGYPGCPGIGMTRAARIIGSAPTLPEAWAAVVQTYDKAGLSESTAIEQARVARILRSGEYNFKRKEVNLWQPPK